MKATTCHLSALALTAVLCCTLHFSFSFTLAWSIAFSVGFLCLADGALILLAIASGQAANSDALALHLGFGLAAFVFGLFELSVAALVFWLRWLVS